MKFEDVELGDELPEAKPDVSLERVYKFVAATGMNFPRFTDHEAAKAEGLPGALVPGIMSQGILCTMIHRWAPGSTVIKIDTVFRSPVITGSQPTCTGAVTDVDEDSRTIEIDLTMTTEAGTTGVLGTATVRFD